MGQKLRIRMRTKNKTGQTLNSKEACIRKEKDEFHLKLSQLFS